MGSKEEVVVGIRARSVLWYLTFIGFAMNYMIRININIAIVDMISEDFKNNKKQVHMSQCHNENSTILEIFDIHNNGQVVVKKDYISLERRILDYFEVKKTCSRNFYKIVDKTFNLLRTD